MRAIGKGSLATILAVMLPVTRVILWISLFGLAVAAVVLPFVPLLVDLATQTEWSREHVHIDVDVEEDDIGDYLGVLLALVKVGVLLYAVDRLLEILKTLRFGSPFVAENGRRLKRIGWALLIGELAKIALVVGSWIALVFGVRLGEGGDGIDVLAWIAVLVVFVLAEVFQEGARIKEEQDFTV